MLTIAGVTTGGLFLSTMTKNRKWLLLVCLAAVAGVLLMQFVWIQNYYQVNKERFEKEVNLAFEDAIKKEQQLRCDTLEHLLLQFLLDTNRVAIRSRWSSKHNCYVYTVMNKNQPGDSCNFSSKLLNKPVVAAGDTVAKQVAASFVHQFRQEDLERHIVYYRTQQVGAYVDKNLERYSFDTTRLRQVFTRVLQERSIAEAFVFNLSDKDSTLNHSHFSKQLQQRYTVITKAFPTYRRASADNYVRAMFSYPARYLVTRLTGILLCSLLLLAVVGAALYYLYDAIQREKKYALIRNDVVNNISHEFKTPIATLSAAVDAMEGFGVLADPAKTKRYLHIARLELQRLEDLSNRILDISLQEERLPADKTQVNIDELVTGLIERYTLRGTPGSSFQWQNETGEAWLYTVEGYLYSMINNLVDNAVKYATGDVAITIRFYRNNGWYHIAVADNGPGIAVTDIRFLFDKYYRVSSGNVHRVKGHGLGLSYVKQAAEKLGGFCQVSSMVGKGSIFTISLPAD